MKKNILILFVVFAFSACDTSSTKKDYSVEDIQRESQKANDFFEEAFDKTVARSPMSQSYLGIKTDYDKWDDLSEAHSREGLELSKVLLKQLRDSINYPALDEQTKISYDLFRAKTEEEIEGYKYNLYDYPVNQMFGLHSKVPSFLINIHTIANKSDAEAYISRLEKVAELFDQLIKSLELRESKGILPPKFVFPRVIDDSKNVIKGYPITSDISAPNPLYDDFKKKVNDLNLSDSDVKVLILRASKALKNHVEPAYEKLIAFLKDQQKRATTDDGVWKFPKGDEFYKFALKSKTTTDMTSDEIFDFGKREIERIHGEMREIMKKVGFKGKLKDFFEFMIKDDRFYYPNTDAGKEAYMVKAEAIIDAMRDHLDELFITKPKAPIIVKRVESFREKSAATAFYNQPSPDGSRPGIYYANLYNTKNMPKYRIEALAYHEGIPGHHMQVAIAQELKGIPKFRKYGLYTAYAEGWGLYTEFLPKEIGFYKDPYSDFGRLAMELWRSCRLVADVGIHSKKWTRERAIEFYKSNTPDSPRDCERMVERHIVMPGQATAYKIGMRKILALREKAKKSLGDKFDIREFHEVVLGSGSLPLNVLEELINNYIERIRAL